MIFKAFIIVLGIISIYPYSAACQKDSLIEKSKSQNAIQFETIRDWNDIVEKAKAEHKYIFIDCYADWCQPCKQMETSVFNKVSVYPFINKNFISVRLEVDKLKYDSMGGLTTLGKEFSTKYEINSLPTYLFFSPEGQILHKDVGYKKENDFIELTRSAMDLNKANYNEYGILKEKFLQNTLSSNELERLISLAESANEKQFSGKVFSSYKNKVLNNIMNDSCIAHIDVRLILRNLDSVDVNDSIFHLLNRGANFVDSLVERPGFSLDIIKSLYNRPNERDALLKQFAVDGQPKWQRLLRFLKSRWRITDAEAIVLSYKLYWTKMHHDWSNYVQYFIKQVESEPLKNSYRGISGILYWNNNAWEIFKYSDNPRYLRKAVGWINHAITLDDNPNVAMLDTKGNLLYKLGHTQEAILLMQKAYPLNKDYIGPTLEKMRAGSATWERE